MPLYLDGVGCGETMTRLSCRVKRGFLQLSALGVLLLVLPPDPSWAQELFANSVECALCHTSVPGALVDSDGNDLSIYHDWSSTMMANSFRDPVFRAKLESERERNPQLSAVIEDKCLTCHAPMTRAQHIRDGGELYTAGQAEQSSLAADGVSCTLCHQIQPDGLGTEPNFSGHFSVGDHREIYGPYRDVFENPMLNHVNYRPLYADHVHESALCGTCHTLFTPYVDNTGRVSGEFPEQTPYLEWLNSSYASADNGRSCQDCHMPRIDEPVKITNRPPWLKNRQSPFWKHHFIGGNAFVLEMLRTHPEAAELDASSDDFQRTIKRTERRLREEAATVSVDAGRGESGNLRITVTVENKTGHKFPSGFPVRRAWLQLQLRDKSGTIIFDSGSWDEHGEIIGLDEGFEPHYELITSADQVQIYQAVMGDVDDKPTFTLLRAAGYLKDNRLVPAGYLEAGPMTEHTKITGKARLDENFNKAAGREGSGTDQLVYEVAVDNSGFPFEIKTSLLYQTVPPKFIGDLLEEKTASADRLARMYRDMSKAPLVIDSVTRVVN